MEAARDNLQGRGGRAGERAAGPELRRHARGPPRVVLAVRPDQPRAGRDVPAVRVGVDGRDGGARGGAVSGVAFGGEEERALSLPVGGCHEAGDDAGAGGRGAAGEMRGVVSAERGEGRGEGLGVRRTLASRRRARCTGTTAIADRRCCRRRGR